MLTATITMETVSVEESNIITRIFKFEEKAFQNGRASYDVEEGRGEIKFFVKAQDSVALRSVLNTITKILAVNDKVKQVLKDEEGY
jgi:tRNA threonylcarbamoyladenosine modification (KEOPS) complex  Pcc1 subunit